MKRRIIALMLVLAVVFVATACNKDKGKSGALVEITAAHTVLPNSLEPISDDATGTMTICYHIYDRLVAFDLENNYIAGIARSWTMIDSRTWEFDINLDDYIFQNGDKLTMDDIVFSFLRIREIPKQADTGNLIESVTYEGNKLQIKFKVENNTLLSRVLTTCVIVNKSYIEAGGDDAIYLNPIGTGPYKVAEFIPGTTVVLETWDGYPFDKPQIDKITFIGVAENAARYISVETGQAQFASTLSAFEIELGNANPDITTFSGASRRTSCFVFSCARPPFDNVNVRRAICHGIDKEAIRSLWGGRAPLDSMVFGGYSDMYMVSPGLPHFDLQLAKELLAAEGFDESNPLTIELTTYPPPDPGLELFQSNMASIGVVVTLNVVEFSVFLTYEGSGEFDMIWTTQLNRGGHPLTDLDRFDYELLGMRDISHYYDARVMEIIARMRITTDNQEMRALITEINEFLGRDVPMFSVFLNPVYCIMANGLTGVFINPDLVVSFRDATYTA